MGKTPCCDKEAVKRGAWSPEEDVKLIHYIKEHGHGNWRDLPKQAGLLRCGKSCRLRWINYLHPDIKRGPFSPEEESIIIRLHGLLGNKWAAIASHLPGRTDNEIKNFWNTRLKKRLLSVDHNLQTRESSSFSGPTTIKSESASTRHMIQWETARVEAEARLSIESLANKTDGDIFLRLWNSRVGESFREITKNDRGVCENAISPMSTPTKLESGLIFGVQAKVTGTSTFTDTTHEQDYSYYRPKVDMMAVSDSNSSVEFTDSDTALKLLLEFPVDNGKEFLHEQTDNVSNFLNLQSD